MARAHAMFSVARFDPTKLELGDLAPRTDAVLEPAQYLDVLTGGGLSADVWERPTCTW
jgi:hypothetical protein